METTTEREIAAPSTYDYKLITDTCKNTPTTGTSPNSTAKHKLKYPKMRPSKTPNNTTQCITNSHYPLQALHRHASTTYPLIDSPDRKMDAHHYLTKGMEREDEQHSEGHPLRPTAHPSPKPRRPTSTKAQTPQNLTQDTLQDIADYNRKCVIRARKERASIIDELGHVSTQRPPQKIRNNKQKGMLIATKPPKLDFPSPTHNQKLQALPSPASISYLPLGKIE
jgi:hypothetical protein